MRFLTQIKIHLSLESTYSFIAFILGIILVFLIPPFQTPDEQTHYFRAAGFIEGSFICEEGRLPISQKRAWFAREMEFLRIAFHPEEKFDLSKIKHFENPDKEGIARPQLPLCYSLSPAHIAPAVAIFVGESIGMNMLHAFYLARIVDLVIAVTLTAIAIRIIPFGKHVLMALGLLPMTIHQFASINYDAFFIPATFLFAAYILKLLPQKEELRAKQKILIIMLSIPVAIIKVAYLPLLLIPLVLLPKKRRNRVKFMIFFGILCGVNIILLILQGLILGTDVPVPEGIHPSHQLRFVFEHPFEFFIIVARTFYHHIDFYLKSFIGYFGWVDYGLDFATYVLSFFSLLIFISLDKTKSVLTRNTRLIFMVATVATISAVILSMFVIATREGELIISGIQGRYFIGVASVGALALYTKGFRLWTPKVRKFLTIALICSLILIIYSMVQAVYNRYYVY